MKARAVAHTMEGLVKYHGLRDWSLRLPYHDSISVNLDAFTTTTEVEFGDFGQDTAFIDNTAVTGREFERIRQVRQISSYGLELSASAVFNLLEGKNKGRVGWRQPAEQHQETHEKGRLIR
ncbi:MAG: hypothetical protein QXR26_09130 [Candidatus Caldarchaeum sp.]